MMWRWNVLPKDFPSFTHKLWTSTNRSTTLPHFKGYILHNIIFLFIIIISIIVICPKSTRDETWTFVRLRISNATVFVVLVVVCVSSHLSTHLSETWLSSSFLLVFLSFTLFTPEKKSLAYPFEMGKTDRTSWEYIYNSQNQHDQEERKMRC